MRLTLAKGHGADHTGAIEPVAIGFTAGIHCPRTVAKQGARKILRELAANIVHPAAMLLLQGKKATVEITAPLGNVE